MNLEWKMKLALTVGRMAGMKAFHEMSPEEARAQEQLPRNFVTQYVFSRTVRLPRVENITMTGRSGSIPGRAYWPRTDRPLPVLVYYHGGGFATGSLDTHDHVCRQLARDAERLVVAVDYRLAPENPFPAGVNDAYDALLWVAENASKLGGVRKDLAVAGDSAGGNLAAVVCQMSRDEGRPEIRKQLLIYPAVDASKKYPSEIELADAPILSEKDVLVFRNHYFNSEDDQYNPRCSPILGRLDGLPETFILTAEIDPLRDQGIAYADALASCGVPVYHQEYRRQVHGFINFPALAGLFDRAFNDMATFLRWD